MKNLLKGSVKAIAKGTAVLSVGFVVFCCGAAYGLNAAGCETTYVRKSSGEES